GETEVVEHLEVFEQRRFRVDVQCPQFTTTRARRDALFGVRQRCGVEGLGDTLPSLDLDEQHPFALVGQGETERRRERCFPGAALPGDEMQPGARELFGPTSHNVPTVKTGRRGAREDPWCASGIPCSPACGGQTSL